MECHRGFGSRNISCAKALVCIAEKRNDEYGNKLESSKGGQKDIGYIENQVQNGRR